MLTGDQRGARGLLGSELPEQHHGLVTALNNAGIYTILDLQAAGSGSVDGIYPNNWPMADADHSITFWSQVASAYKSDPAVLYDLYNEPFIGKSNPTTSISC